MMKTIKITIELECGSAIVSYILDSVNKVVKEINDTTNTTLKNVEFVTTNAMEQPGGSQ